MYNWDKLSPRISSYFVFKNKHLINKEKQVLFCTLELLLGSECKLLPSVYNVLNLLHIYNQKMYSIQ